MINETEEISNLNIPKGIPHVYELDENLHPIRHYYLGDAKQVEQATQVMANQALVKHEPKCENHVTFLWNYVSLSE